MHWIPRLAAACLLAVSICLGAERPRHQLNSPDGRLKVNIDFPSGPGQRPLWSAAFRGKSILSDCRLGLETSDAGELMAGVELVKKQERSSNERVAIPFGRADHAMDRFNELRLNLVTPQGRRTDVVFRCYDDGVALRYELPAGQTAEAVTIRNETTSFRLAENPTAFVQYLEHFKTSHEHPVEKAQYREIRRGTLLDLPLTFSFSDGTYVALTEAALRNYAGMALMRPASEGARDELVCALTPRPDGNKVVRPLPMLTPWRVALVAERPGALLESGTIFCLNESSAVQDISWIKPGKTTFHWWNGDVFDGKPGLPMLSLEMSKKYIDFCASNGIPYHALSSTEGVTTPWYQQSKPGVEPGPDTDVTKPRPGFDLAAIKEYADSKGVRLWTWVHQAALKGRVEEAFAAFERMGWKGMMVDFFDHDDQETVQFAEEVLAAAARHRIMIHLHGVWKPTGLERTYPNLMNHEGALNLEYLKWSDRCTPEHDVMMAFTRLIAGPMDYHLGGFRAVSRAAFKPVNVGPNVLGTRGHQLAMYVCFDNPTPMVADYPAAYEGQAGFEFLTTIPTYWDETRVLAGRIGEVLVTARRKGRAWYLGGLGAGQSREASLPLGFLGEGRYKMTIWRDVLEENNDPNRLIIDSSMVSKGENMSVRTAQDGGFVARFTPESN